MFSGAFVFLAFGEPPTSVEGTRDYSTDFFPPRYVKFHVTRSGFHESLNFAAFVCAFMGCFWLQSEIVFI
ncbi:hypothetical protein EIV45_20400 [Salmonella enterica]|nr:hypothetical protein [Salmonella enterica]